MADVKKLITMTRVNETGGYDTLYPKTLASQVFIDASTTLADHVVDTTVHLTSTERSALTATNNANGYVKLDSNGYVPTGLLNPSVLAVNKEFADITALLAASTTDIVPGQIVMVLDASADSTVDSGWAIYRRLTSASDLSQLSSWQKIAERESLDVVVNWANIVDKPSSTVANIDDAVTKRHIHANSAVLDKFTEDANGLKYNGSAVAFTNSVIEFKVVDSASIPAASTLKANDLVFVVSGTVE